MGLVMSSVCGDWFSVRLAGLSFCSSRWLRWAGGVGNSFVLVHLDVGAWRVGDCYTLSASSN